jgi:hypothetical protein
MAPRLLGGGKPPGIASWLKIARDVARSQARAVVQFEVWLAAFLLSPARIRTMLRHAYASIMPAEYPVYHFYGSGSLYLCGCQHQSQWHL